MRLAYKSLLASPTPDEVIDDFVDRELRRTPRGAVEIAGRLNWLRREETFPEACGDAPEAIRAVIGAAVIALRRGSPNAAAKLRSLGDIACRGNLKIGLDVLARVGPVAVATAN